MNIGQRVRVKAVTSFFYEDSRRTYERRPDAFEAYVTGAVNRPIGVYHPARTVNPFMDDGDYEPPSLSVTGTVKVFKVRKRLFGREYDVHPDDLEKLQ